MGGQDADLLVVGDGPGADEVARAAGRLGLRVTVGACLADREGRRCVLAPRARSLRPDWWSVPPTAPPSAKPDSVVVVGGGHTGVEAALAWAGRAGRVALVEATGQVLPGWDVRVVAHVTAALVAAGVEVRTGWRAVALEPGPRGGGVVVCLRRRGEDADRREAASLAVPALGLRPDFTGLELAATPVLTDRLGFLQVDSRLETAEPRLHALGAALALPLTAAVVARQARAVASCAAGQPLPPIRYRVLPRVIHGSCEALTAGLTAAEACARGHRTACGQAGDAHGWIACVRDAETGAALGVHAAGEGAALLEELVADLLGGTGVDTLPDAARGANANAASRLAAAFATATEECRCDG